MLSLLLDEQISPSIADQLRRRNSKIHVLALSEWHSGTYLSAYDYEILLAANVEKLSLVTYDLSTISPLLRSMHEQGKQHGGVIFIDNKTIPSNQFGVLVTALETLWGKHKTEIWDDRVVFLSTAS